MMGCGGQNHGLVEGFMRGSKWLTQAAQKIYDGKSKVVGEKRWQEKDGTTTYIATSAAVVSAFEEGE